MAAKSCDLYSDNSKWLRMTTGIIPENLVQIEAFTAEIQMFPFSVAILNMAKKRDICWRAFVPLQHTLKWSTFIKKWGQDGPKRVFHKIQDGGQTMWPTYAIFELVWWFHPRTIPIKFGKLSKVIGRTYKKKKTNKQKTKKKKQIKKPTEVKTI